VIGRLALALLLGGASPLLAQATPTASRAGDLQVGVGYTLARPDYGQQFYRGFTAFADFDLRSHLGVEAEFRPARKAHPAFLVEDLAGLTATLIAAGHRVVGDEPLEFFDRVFTDDPFGNRIELMEPRVPRASPDRPE